MNDNLIDVPALTAAGFEALKRDDLNTARESFGRAVTAGTADAAAWFGLSLVHRRLGAASEESAALDEALKLDAHHLPALIAKGDLYARSRDLRAANSYYGAAIKLAVGMPSLPSQWRNELQRIETACNSFARDYEAHLLAALDGESLGDPGTDRFGHALDLLLGKRQIYFQQPKHFFFPELPQIQFYDRRIFPWAETLERHTGSIGEELRAVVKTGTGIVPYIQREAHRPVFNTKGLVDNPDWGAFYLVKSGAEVPENAARCPRTMAALRAVPTCRIKGRTPSVLFSFLRPGARIPPHHGFMNTRLICHLPLIVPPDCALRVGNETRGWREGELLVFDDSIEHEAWNLSQELRVVLIFDVWRPELSEKEQALVAAMLQSIDSFGGPRREWTD
jgi:aspartyl/asparaginyl beta-hydroxylase (cupin superfamily)